MSFRHLLLFFLCISLHACSARRLSTLDEKLEKKSHFSIKNDAINGFDSFPKQLRVVHEVNRMKTWLVALKPRKGRSTNKRVLKATREDSDALEPTKSLVSVSWPVPHMTPCEKNPGFNLDYSPPKTHPPTNN